MKELRSAQTMKLKYKVFLGKPIAENQFSWIIMCDIMKYASWKWHLVMLVQSSSWRCWENDCFCIIPSNVWNLITNIANNKIVVIRLFWWNDRCILYPRGSFYEGELHHLSLADRGHWHSGTWPKRKLGALDVRERAGIRGGSELPAWCHLPKVMGRSQ